MRTSFKFNRGITLVELVLTIVVVSIGLVGIMVVFENVTKGVMQADLNVMASNLAREKIEQIIVDTWRDGYDTILQSSYPNENFQSEFSIFTRSTSIYEVAGSDLSTPQSGSGYKRLEVTVSWGGEPIKQISIPTVLAKYK